MTGQPAAGEAPESGGPLVAVLMYAGVSELELGVMLGALLALGGGPEFALTVARTRGSVVCAGGLVSTPQVMFAALPTPAGILIPGGPGAQKAAKDPVLLGFLTAQHAQGVPVGACGSGLYLAGEAGLLRDRAVGVNAELADTIWGYGPAEVQPGMALRDGELYSAPAGLGALEVTLALGERLWGQDAAAAVRARLQLPPLGTPG